MFEDNQLTSFLRLGCVVDSESAMMISKSIFKVELSRFHQVRSSPGDFTPQQVTRAANQLMQPT
jgi:hypothetical protein